MRFKFLTAMLVTTVAVAGSAGAAVCAGALGYDRMMPTQEEIREWYEDNPFDIHSMTEYTEDWSTEEPQSAGTISEATQEEALNAVNFCRFIAGLPDDVSLSYDERTFTFTNNKTGETKTVTSSYPILAQCSSLVTYMNGGLDHTPVQPVGLDDDLYDLGYLGSSKSNIARGYYNLSAATIQGYMYDSNDKNIEKMGHRRWILNPNMLYTGFGMVDNGSAMYCMDKSRRNIMSFTGDYICWPAENTPNELVDVGDTGYAYSITLGSEYDSPKLDEVSVDMSSKLLKKSWHLDKNDNNKANYATEYLNVDTGNYGINKFIVWNVGKLPKNDVVTVTVSGIYKNGVEAPITYTVTYFDLIENANYTAGFEKNSYTIKVGETLTLCGYNDPLSDGGYYLGYKNNDGSAEWKTSGPVLTVTGIAPTKNTDSPLNFVLGKDGSYIDNLNVNIYVVAADKPSIIDCDISVEDVYYTGKRQKPPVTVTYKGKLLTEDVDYRLSYSNNKNIGTAIVSVIGMGDYADNVTVYFSILDPNQADSSSSQPDDTSSQSESSKPDDTSSQSESSKPDDTSSQSESSKPDDTSSQSESSKPDDTSSQSESSKPDDTSSQSESSKPDDTSSETESSKPDDTSSDTDSSKPDDSSESPSVWGSVTVADKNEGTDPIDLTGVSIVFTDREGNETEAETSGTGYSAKLPDGIYSMTVSKNGYVPRTLEVTVENGIMSEISVKLHHYGDVDGDGIVGATDNNRAISTIKGVAVVSGYEFACIDLDGDGTLSAMELVRITDVVKGLSTMQALNP